MDLYFPLFTFLGNYTELIMNKIVNFADLTLGPKADIINLTNNKIDIVVNMIVSCSEKFEDI